MKHAGIRELKQNASAVVAEVAEGEIVIITDRGRAVAQLVPISSNRLAGLVEAGRARPPRRRLADLGRPPRRRHGERALSEVLEEQREHERY
jgi:prevent-host-death family protein